MSTAVKKFTQIRAQKLEVNSGDYSHYTVGNHDLLCEINNALADRKYVKALLSTSKLISNLIALTTWLVSKKRITANDRS